MIFIFTLFNIFLVRNLKKSNNISWLEEHMKTTIIPLFYLSQMFKILAEKNVLFSLKKNGFILG